MSITINNPSLQRQVSHLRSLGDRALAEFLIEFASVAGGHDDLRKLLESYAGASPEVMAAVGGDAFVPLYAYGFGDDGTPRPLRRIGGR